MKETLTGLKLKRHPDKTFIGSGFEFLGYAFSPSGLEIPQKTFVRFALAYHPAV